MIYNEVSEMLERNTILLIEKICNDIDRIDAQFDKLDEDMK